MGLKWGLVSTAKINDAVLPFMDVAAVGSRSRERADAYAREKGIARAHGSYEDLLADPEVEAVYISLPNGLHAEWTLRALEAGKHVLCEKPFSRHVHEVERCFDEAERRGLTLSEAFMWRHHPQARRLKELVDAGDIGELRMISAWFSFPLDRPADPRWDARLDGGALMDVGCYCINAARMLAGEPHAVVGLATGEDVDARFAGVLRFPSGVLAHFDCGFDLPARHGLEVLGSEGGLRLDDPWHGKEAGLGVPEAKPYQLEVEDFEAAVREGRPPLLGREDAVGQARVLGTLLG